MPYMSFHLYHAIVFVDKAIISNYIRLLLIAKTAL